MKKSIWIFLFAVLLPGFVLGWLALRSAEEQQIIFERRTAELYQKETENLAANARDVVEAERRAFGDTVHRLLARSDAEALARDFTNSLTDAWPRKAVGFVLGKNGEMLSPTTTMATKNADLRKFLWDNGSFLCSTQPAVVYPVSLETTTKTGPGYAQSFKTRAGAPAPDGKPALSVSNGPNPTLLAQKGGNQNGQQREQAMRFLKEPIPMEQKTLSDSPKGAEEATQLAFNRNRGVGPSGTTDSSAPATSAALENEGVAGQAPALPSGGADKLAQSENRAALSASAPSAPTPVPQPTATPPATLAPAPTAAAAAPAPPPPPAPAVSAPSSPPPNAPGEKPSAFAANAASGPMPQGQSAPSPLGRGGATSFGRGRAKESDPLLGAANPSGASQDAPQKKTEQAASVALQVPARGYKDADPSALGQKQQVLRAENPGTEKAIAPTPADESLAADQDVSSAKAKVAGGAREPLSAGVAGGLEAQTGNAAVSDAYTKIEVNASATTPSSPEALFFQKSQSQEALNRMVEPQQQLRSPVSNWSAILPATADFRALTAGNDEGMLARFVQDKLDLVFWIRPPEAPEMVFGCLIEAADLDQLWKDVFASRAAPVANERPPFVLALLNDKARPVATFPVSETAREWKRPFVANEIGEVLPHWEAALYLATPTAMADTARGLRRTLSFTIAGAIALIAIGGWLVVHDVRRQLALAQQKTDFVSNVSHELKTPLTSIRMFAELMHDRPPAAEKQGQYLRIIRVEAERLTRLINNVLDFAKLERRQRRFEKKSLDLCAVITRVWEGQEMHLRDAGFATKWQAAPGPYPVLGDEDALAQILVNLLSNAEKYSQDRKEVELVTWLDDDCVNASILDRGIGVPDGEERKIFEAFYRAHDSLSSGIQGSGLGLTLAQRVAREHGGEIVFERRHDGGSRFTLRLPLAHSTGEDSPTCGERDTRAEPA
jgi:signal transduction histidine kinase